MKAALVVLYNHHFPGNIDRLNAIHGERFSHILHLIPFAEVFRPDAVRVYEESYYFSGHVAQSLDRLLELNADHFIFAADDMLLNPRLTESTYAALLQLDQNSAFIPGWIDLGARRRYWSQARRAFLWNPATRSVNARDSIPSADVAAAAIHRTTGIVAGTVSLAALFHGRRVLGPASLRTALKVIGGRTLPPRTAYPLVGSYSDFFAIPRTRLKEFAHLAGVFAASRLFVEIAIPTAIALTTERVSTLSSVGFRDGAIWSAATVEALKDRHGSSIGQVLRGFEHDLLYLHPIKLSQWKD